MKNLFIAALLLISFSSCKKDVDELPPATQTGANTFGAKLNGSFWVPQGFGVVPTAPLLEARFQGNNTVLINARNFSSSPTETEFEIYLVNITAPGVFLLNQNTAKVPNASASYGYYEVRRFRPEEEYFTNSTHTGSVTVTRYDVTNRIISGTFEFTAQDKTDPSKTITVTEGRFDLPLL